MCTVVCLFYYETISKICLLVKKRKVLFVLGTRQDWVFLAFLGGNYVFMFPCEKLEALIVLVELSKKYFQLYSDLNPNSVCQYCSCGLSV